jgi:hypothetical protein
MNFSCSNAEKIHSGEKVNWKRLAKSKSELWFDFNYENYRWIERKMLWDMLEVTMEASNDRNRNKGMWMMIDMRLKRGIFRLSIEKFDTESWGEKPLIRGKFSVTGIFHRIFISFLVVNEANWLSEDKLQTKKLENNQIEAKKA